MIVTLISRPSVVCGVDVFLSESRELRAQLLETREVGAAREDVNIRKRRLHPARERLVLRVLL
jgi:hypothetical protein